MPGGCCIRRHPPRASRDRSTSRSPERGGPPGWPRGVRRLTDKPRYWRGAPVSAPSAPLTSADGVIHQRSPLTGRLRAWWSSPRTQARPHWFRPPVESPPVLGALTRIELAGRFGNLPDNQLIQLHLSELEVSRAAGSSQLVVPNTPTTPTPTSRETPPITRGPQRAGRSRQSGEASCRESVEEAEEEECEDEARSSRQ